MSSAARLAYFNGACFGVFCVASALLLPLVPTIAGVLMTLFLGLVTYNEFRGRTLLLAYEPRGARLLGWNQLLLLAALVAYCVWSIVWGFVYPNPLSDILTERPELLASYSEAERRDLRDALDVFSDFWPAIIASTYGAVIVVSVFYQGANAWYNFSRERYVRQCKAERTS